MTLSMVNIPRNGVSNKVNARQDELEDEKLPRDDPCSFLHLLPSRGYALPPDRKLEGPLFSEIYKEIYLPKLMTLLR